MGQEEPKQQVIRATVDLVDLPADFESLLAAFLSLRGEMAVLRRENADLRADNGLLERENAELRRQVGELKQQLERNSQNSSTPPSADPPSAPSRPPKPQSGKKPGGQPGHARHERPVPPPEKVNQPPIHLRPDHCFQCKRSLLDIEGTVKPFYRYEVPEPVPDITPFLQHSVVCPDCRAMNVAPLPPEARSPFGPRAMAILALLTGIFHLSKRKAARAMLALFGIPIATGSVPACEKIVSEAVEKPVEEARAHVKQQGVKQGDETGWFHGSDRAKAYLWVAYTKLVTVFLYGVTI